MDRRASGADMALKKCGFRSADMALKRCGSLSADVDDTKVLLKKKEMEIRCLLKAIKLGEAAGEIYVNRVQPLLLHCHKTNQENFLLQCKIDDFESALSEMLDTAYSFRSMLSKNPFELPLDQTSTGSGESSTRESETMSNSKMELALTGHLSASTTYSEIGPHALTESLSASAATILMECATLSASADRALQNCISIPQVSDIILKKFSNPSEDVSSIPDERLVAEIKELHFQTSSSLQSEELLKKMDQMIKLLVELLRRRQAKRALHKTSVEYLCPLHKSYDTILKENVCLKRDLDYVRCAHAKRRKILCTFLEKVSVEMSNLRDEMERMLSRVVTTDGLDRISEEHGTA